MGLDFLLLLSKGGLFDLAGTGRKYEISWTAPRSSNAFLVLDRNENGVIDDGTELFGDATPQPKPKPHQSRNGFLALAQYDQPAYGRTEIMMENRHQTS
jgi:hypothetical protein